MKILISNTSDMPIYAQISTQIKEQILNGVLEEGDSLPSIRGLAKDLQVSVITTKRAYDDLEKEAFIETMQGKVSFVTMQNKELIREKKLTIIEEKLNEVVKDSKILGLKFDELQSILKILFEEE